VVRQGRGRTTVDRAGECRGDRSRDVAETPKETHWSYRLMAKADGASSATVQRTGPPGAHAPSRGDVKLCNDERFDEKLVDVVGLYLNRPRERAHPVQRLQAQRDHDLFAALNVLTGSVIGQVLAPTPPHGVPQVPAHDRQGSQRLQGHLILDNYATHKHENVQAWIAKHPRFELHVTPTSSSWLNLVKIFFGKLTDKATSGVLNAVPDLIAAIDAYQTNKHPEPFIWIATTEHLLEKVRRGRATLEAITS
jgi:hypothetical protein